MENISDRTLLYLILAIVSIILIGLLFVRKSGGSISFGIPKFVKKIDNPVNTDSKFED